MLQVKFTQPDGLGHAHIRDNIDNGGPDTGFGNLPLGGSGEQAVAQLLQPAHHVLRKAASVVAAIALPGGVSLGVDIFENGARGMTVSPVKSAVARRNGRTGVPVRNGDMAAFRVVSAGRHLGDFAFHLVKQTPGNTSSSAQSVVVTLTIIAERAATPYHETY